MVIAVDPLVGQLVNDNYSVIDLIGAGAMGKVYLADQISLGKRVALKVLHAHLHEDPTSSKRFHREALAASRLSHPNCIQVFDFGEAKSGELFIAMEFLDGKSLGDLIREEFPIPTSRLNWIMQQVCSALDEAHEQGIIHRDLKPENIMVVNRRNERDLVKVLDFGIAKLQARGGPSQGTVTTGGNAPGTPEYMSPEQARMEELDPRSDIYSLGVILFQLVTGTLPFTGPTPLLVVSQHLMDEVPLPSSIRPDLEIDSLMDRIVLECMAKLPDDRPSSAMGLWMRLEALATPAPGSMLLTDGSRNEVMVQLPGDTFDDDPGFEAEPTRMMMPDSPVTGSNRPYFAEPDLPTIQEEPRHPTHSPLSTEETTDTAVEPARSGPESRRHKGDYDDDGYEDGAGEEAGGGQAATLALLIAIFVVFVVLGLSVVALVAVFLFVM